jgi:hypothetical protein
MTLGLRLEASPTSFNLTFKRTIKLSIPASDLGLECSTEVFYVLDFGSLKCTTRLLVLGFVPGLEGVAELFSALDFGCILG